MTILPPSLTGTGRSGALRAPGSLHKTGAGKETRTPDPHLGKVMLYQLSYSRSDEEAKL